MSDTFYVKKYMYIVVIVGFYSWRMTDIHFTLYIIYIYSMSV